MGHFCILFKEFPPSVTGDMVFFLCVSGSPRAGGNSEAMISRFHEGVLSAKAKSTLLRLRELDLRGCDGCDGCNAEHKCHIDDEMQAIYSLLEKADVWVFASPVYWWNISGLLKNFIDRFEIYWADEPFKALCAKKRAVILTCGGQPEAKNKEAEEYLELFFQKLHLKVIGKIRASAEEKGSISKQKLNECFALGKKLGAEIR